MMFFILIILNSVNHIQKAIKKNLMQSVAVMLMFSLIWKHLVKIQI